MRTVEEIQSKRAFDAYEAFRRDYEANNAGAFRPDELRSDWPTDHPVTGVCVEQKKTPWRVTTYRQLADRVAFLTSVNYRWLLFFRGQNSIGHDPIPAIFRPKWRCFGGGDTLDTPDQSRQGYWKFLIEDLGPVVAEICMDVGSPNYWHIANVREAQWAVIQHYGLWPTPLLDLTLSLRVAASFAFHGSVPERDETRGYVLVAAMPEVTGSIAYDSRERVVLTRLQSACPPVALRPHYQEGFFAGSYPARHMGDTEPLLKWKEESDLRHRMVAIFELDNSEGGFWDEDFPKIKRNVLYPEDDVLLRRFADVYDNGERLRAQASVYSG